MKKKLYYTVEKESDGMMLTGMKIVSVYEILKQGDQGYIPKAIIDLDIPISASSALEAEDWLNDNGFGDTDFELILL